MKCERCGWGVLEGRICDECERIAVFKIAAHIIAEAVMSQPCLLVRMRLIKKFFEVAINQWELLSMFGPVHSATRNLSSENTPQSGASS